MDRASLIDLFDYTTFTWATYGKLIERLPPDAFTQPIAGSGWPTLRAPLFHLATAWDEWLRDQLQIEGSSLESAEITTWAGLAPLREQTRGWLRRIIDEADDGALAVRRPMWVGTPAETHRTSGDVVAHILLHERGHHGDITTLLEAAGAQIPAMDYLVYVFFRDRTHA